VERVGIEERRGRWIGSAEARRDHASLEAGEGPEVDVASTSTTASAFASRI